MRVSRLLLVLVTVILASCTGSGSSPQPAGDSAATAVDRSDIPETFLYLRPVDQMDPDGPFELAREVGAEVSIVPTPAGGDVLAVDVDPLGESVAYQVRLGESVGIWMTRLVDASAQPVLVLADTDLGCPSWFPDSERLVFLGDDGRIEIMDLSTEGTTLVREPGRGRSSCPDALDDHRIVFGFGTNEERAELRSLDVRTGDEQTLGTVPDGCLINNPAVAPTGDTIALDAYCPTDRSHNGIWTIPATGGAATLVVGDNPAGAPHSESAQYWEPAWTADGSAIVYHRSGNALASLHLVAADGTKDQQVLEAVSCCAAIPHP